MASHTLIPSPAASQWWTFVDPDPSAPATGRFRAVGTEHRDRLYFPLVNEGGMLSWTSPRLQGSPAVSHNAYLGVPLTAEDPAHSLIHWDFWLVEDGHAPVSLAGLSPEGLTAHLQPPQPEPAAWIEAAPGWFTLTRRDPAGRYQIRGEQWCPADLDEPVQLLRVTVANASIAPLNYLAYAAVPMYARSADNVRDHRHVTVLLHRLERLSHGVSVCPTMTFDERGHKVNALRYVVLANGPGGETPEGIWAVEEQFLGEGGNFAAPAAVWQRHAGPPADRATTPGREAIGAFRFAARSLAPGESVEYLVLAGITPQPRKPAAWQRWMTRPSAAEQSLARTHRHWQETAHRIQFSTSQRPLDHWLTWVMLQPTLRRLYGNSYLPQFDYGRGGRGWRDLWQDALALLLGDPVPVRPMLLHNIAGVRIDGSNATIIGKDGSFIADRNNIPRTWMDHGVWPLYATLLYLDQTGDWDVLFEPRSYFRDPQQHRCRRQDPSWTPRYGNELRTRRGRVYLGSVLEHLLVQTLTAFFNVGEHNLLRLEGADWNDGLDMARGRGESVAFSAFYAWNLQRLAQLSRELHARGVRTIRVAEELRLLLDRRPGQRRIAYGSTAAKRRTLERYLDTMARDVSGKQLGIATDALAADLEAKHRDLADRIGTQEWLHVGDAGLFNGYYDERGRRVEGRRRGQVRMTLTGQVFPVMAGIATDEQVDQVVHAVDRWLRDPVTGGVRLNTDFGDIQPELGRAFSFAYGEKENGAVFSHMAVLYAFALYMRRRAAQGRSVWAGLYAMATNQPAAKIFPCLPEYFNAEGRGLYCYLTGSASWLIYLLLTQVYGVRGERGDLVIDPQLTREDFGDRPAIGVETHFAGRRVAVSFDAQTLAGSRGGTLEVRCGDRQLPAEPRPGGGVRIPRRAVTQLPASSLAHLTVRRRGA